MATIKKFEIIKLDRGFTVKEDKFLSAEESLGKVKGLINKSVEDLLEAYKLKPNGNHIHISIEFQFDIEIPKSNNNG